MSANSYLSNVANKLVLNLEEQNSIRSSISTLSDRLNWHFGSDVVQHFQFGSNTRGTILPRTADPESDVDYMIVFNTAGGTYKPQTYLDKLKRFVNDRYSTSEISQDHPTIVLDLQHIRFELVPAIQDWVGNYQIPSTSNYYYEWMATDPSGFKEKLVQANVRHNSLIKPLARLVKYWNIRKNSGYYGSYPLEEFVVERTYYNHDYLKDYFYNFWDQWSPAYNEPQYVKDNIAYAKQIVRNARSYESAYNPDAAENEMRKLIPNF